MEIRYFAKITQIITISKKEATKIALFVTKFETPKSEKVSFANRSPFRAYFSYAHSYPHGIVFVRDPQKPPLPIAVFFFISPYSSPSHHRFAFQ